GNQNLISRSKSGPPALFGGVGVFRNRYEKQRALFLDHSACRSLRPLPAGTLDQTQRETDQKGSERCPAAAICGGVSPVSCPIPDRRRTIPLFATIHLFSAKW